MEIRIDRRPLSERLRHVDYRQIVDLTVKCCIEAACVLPPDVLEAIKQAAEKETSGLGRDFLNQYIENARVALEENSPICQDTGFAVFFVELGEDVVVDGGSVCGALTEGTAKGYELGFLRKSIVSDPLFKRVNTRNNTPPIIHLSQVPGDRIKVTLAPKGGGSENMSALKMLKPSDGKNGVVDFVVNTVVNAGGSPCPPTIVGVGIGGTSEEAMLLAKKALLRRVGAPNPDPEYAALEKEILEKINSSGVGPQGLGGDTTSFAVHIDHHPCHIASLPVAVNLNCHAARHASFEL